MISEIGLCEKTIKTISESKYTRRRVSYLLLVVTTVLFPSRRLSGVLNLRNLPPMISRRWQYYWLTQATASNNYQQQVKSRYKKMQLHYFLIIGGKKTRLRQAKACHCCCAFLARGFKNPPEPANTNYSISLYSDSACRRRWRLTITFVVIETRSILDHFYSIIRLWFSEKEGIKCLSGRGCKRERREKKNSARHEQRERTKNSRKIDNNKNKTLVVLYYYY